MGTGLEKAVRFPHLVSLAHSPLPQHSSLLFQQSLSAINKDQTILREIPLQNPTCEEIHCRHNVICPLQRVMHIILLK